MRPDDPFAPTVMAASETPRHATPGNPRGLEFPILPFARELARQSPIKPIPGPFLAGIGRLRPPPAVTPAAPARPRKPLPSPRLQALRNGAIIAVGNQGADLLRRVGQGLITPGQAHANFNALTERPDFSPKAIIQLRSGFSTGLVKAAQLGQKRTPPARVMQTTLSADRNGDSASDRFRIAPSVARSAELAPGAQVQRVPARQDPPAFPDEAAALTQVARREKSDRFAVPDATGLIQVERTGKSDRIDPPEDFLTQLAGRIGDANASLDRDRGNGKSINDAIEVFGDVTDAVTRVALRDTFGDEAAQSHDDINASFSRAFRELSAWLHRGFDRIGARDGLSDKRIAELKIIADAAIATAAFIGPGRAPRRRRNRGADDPDTPANSNRRPSDDTSPSPQVRPDRDNVSLSVTPGLPVVEVGTERLRSSNARRGTPEWEMLNNPDANTIYKLDNGETFRTNSFGNTEELVHKPGVDKRGRNRRQTQVGNEGLDNDVGGHLRACSLGGSCDLYNLFSQNVKFNNRKYRKWENMIRRDIEKVEAVKITLIRNDPSKPRPDHVLVEWVMDGVRICELFDNEPGGR